MRCEWYGYPPADGLLDFACTEKRQQKLRREVGAVRPYDGPRLGIKAHLPEETHVAEGHKHLAGELGGQVDLSFDPIVESQEKDVVLHMPYVFDLQHGITPAARCARRQMPHIAR